MKSKLWQPLLDIVDIFRLRMKLIGKDYITLIVLISSLVLFGVILRSLTLSAEELSSLPIGIVDYDNSKSSKELMLGLEKVDTIRIIQKSENELQKLLMDEMITSIFIIEKGYEKKLKAGNLNKLITMYYKEENKSASIISDIVAGEMLMPACLYKSFRIYEGLSYEGEKLSLSEYKDYIQEVVASSEDFNFAFEINYYNSHTGAAAETEITNTILYNQFIFGILGLMMAFIAMFILSQTVKDKETGVEIKLRISRYRILIRDMGNLLALLMWEGLLSLIYTWMVFHQLKLSNPGLFLSSYLLLVLNAFTLGGIMLLISKVMKSMLTYQVFCSVFLLFTGGLGFYHILSGFYKGFIDNMVKFIPNSWFIQGFTDIIIYGGKLGYLNEGHQMLFVMVTIIVIIIIGIDLLQEIPMLNIRNKKNRTVQ